MNTLCKFILFATISANVLGDTDNVEIVDVTCDYGEDNDLISLSYDVGFTCTISDVDYTSKNRSNFNILNADSSKDVVQLRMVTGHYDVLPLNLFKVFPKLKKLEIETGLKAITKENFIGGGKQLEILMLAGNEIAAIDDHTFDGMVQLEIIDLEGNKLVNIESSTFTGAVNLRELVLSSNQIETIEDGAFNIKTLDTIYLTRNKLKTLTDDVFVGAAELRHVYLHLNRLTQIGKSIENIPKLRTVSLSTGNVKITDFDFHAIARKPDLRGFLIESVGLTLDDPVSAANDNNVDILDISRNNLAYPDILNRLRNFRNLTSLYIGFNDFATISDIENIKEIFPKLERLVVNELPCKDEIVGRLQKKFGNKVRLDDPIIFFN